MKERTLFSGGEEITIGINGAKIPITIKDFVERFIGGGNRAITAVMAEEIFISTINEDDLKFKSNRIRRAGRVNGANHVLVKIFSNNKEIVVSKNSPIFIRDLLQNKNLGMPAEEFYNACDEVFKVKGKERDKKELMIATVVYEETENRATAVEMDTNVYENLYFIELEERGFFPANNLLVGSFSYGF